MDSYDPVLSSQALSTLLGLPKKKQQELAGSIYRLAALSSQTGDFALKDRSGRDLEYIYAGEFVISFWADHPVREFRIVEIDRI